MRGFPSIICGLYKSYLPLKAALFGDNSVPFLSAVGVFAGFSKNVTPPPRDNEGRLYCLFVKFWGSKCFLCLFETNLSTFQIEGLLWSYLIVYISDENENETF